MGRPLSADDVATRLRARFGDVVQVHEHPVAVALAFAATAPMACAQFQLPPIANVMSMT